MIELVNLKIAMNEEGRVTIQMTLDDALCEEFKTPVEEFTSRINNAIDELFLNINNNLEEEQING